ncbi:hypothetical protein SAMN04488541_106019 [Thermoflexibacter ruber]|uniref:Uncharacterized protein n=2 Tax=Thermoflexibacter ruber TaxID=1003 RepID=A0A1I2JSE4_9BACT|nr:hypothetical protein SAMN04488541_106019 [Thermoflexibacter ruber]
MNIKLAMRLLSLDFKLIIRNRYPKNILFISLYSFVMYLILVPALVSGDPEFILSDMLIIMSYTLIPCLLSIYYSGSIFALSNSFIEIFATKKLAIKYLIKVRVYFSFLLSIFSFIIYLFITLFLFPDSIFYYVCLSTFSIGVYIPLLLYFTVDSRDTIDLAKNVFLNFTNRKFDIPSFIGSLVIVAISIIIFILFQKNIIFHVVILLIGLASLFCSHFWIEKIYKKWQGSKYLLIQKS